MKVPQSERLSALCLYCHELLRRPSLTMGYCCARMLLEGEQPSASLPLLGPFGWIIVGSADVEGCSGLCCAWMPECLAPEVSSAAVLLSDFPEALAARREEAIWLPLESSLADLAAFLCLGLRQSLDPVLCLKNTAVPPELKVRLTKEPWTCILPAANRNFTLLNSSPPNTAFQYLSNALLIATPARFYQLLWTTKFLFRY